MSQNILPDACSSLAVEAPGDGCHLALSKAIAAHVHSLASQPPGLNLPQLHHSAQAHMCDASFVSY